MEALALLIGELIFVILIPFIALVVELFAAAVSALVAALSGRKRAPNARGSIAKPVAVVLAGLSGLVLVAPPGRTQTARPARRRTGSPRAP
ncbi:MAG: hypothetical protein AAGJ36_12600, partial [Pseudomonadota bacterium]